MRESWINNPIRVAKIGVVAADVAALLAVAAIELWRAGMGFDALAGRWIHVLPFAAFVLLYPSLLFALGLYDHLEAAPRTRHPVTLIVTFSLWALAVSQPIAGPARAATLWPGSLLIGAVMGSLLWLFRSRAMRPARFEQRTVGVLLLGWDRSMELLVQALRTHPYRRRSIIGILAAPASDPRPHPDLRVPELSVREARVAMVMGQACILALPVAEPLSVAAQRLVRDRPNHVQATTAVTIYEGLVHKVPITAVGDRALEPAVRQRKPRLGRPWQVLHRWMDILVAGTLLLVTWPVMLVVATCSFVLQGRPIIFAQERVGFEGRLFTIYKFRTMKVLNRSRAENELMTTVGDARLTRWGRILRRLHLDELPQLWNILRGDMSLIGPRPISKELDSRISSRMPFWDLRYLVHPGATGWEQVCSGDSRNETGHCERLERDLYYIEHASIMLDMYILLKTPGVLLRRRGAR